MLSYLFVVALQTEQISISVATLEWLIAIFLPYVLLHAWILVLIQKHAGLRLEVFNTKIRSQYVFCQLLLQFLFNFLAKSLMNQRIIRIELCQHYNFEASNNPLFCKLNCFHYLQYFFIFKMNFIEIINVYELIVRFF